MTTVSALAILGRPFNDYQGPSAYMLVDEHPELEEIAGEDGEDMEKLGFRSLYQGNSYFGVPINGGWDQGKPQLASGCAASWTPKEEARAKAICDALPQSVKDRPDLMPFGAYLVGTDG